MASYIEGEEEENTVLRIEWPPKPEKCAEGETWKECVGSSCAELTCEHPKPPRGCTEDCGYGCYCAPDFFRNANKKCVKKDKCP